MGTYQTSDTRYSARSYVECAKRHQTPKFMFDHHNACNIQESSAVRGATCEVQDIMKLQHSCVNVIVPDNARSIL